MTKAEFVKALKERAEFSTLAQAEAAWAPEKHYTAASSNILSRCITSG